MTTPTREIQPASGRLGILLPGLGAVATTFIAGVARGAPRPGAAHRLAHPAGHDPARQAHREPLAAHLATSCRSRASTTSSSAAGTSSPTTPTSRRARRRSRGPHLEPRRDRARRDQADAGRLLPRVRQAPARHARQDAAEQGGPGRAAVGGHRDLQPPSEGCDALVMVWCGSTEIYLERERRHTSRSSRSRQGLRDKRRRHRAVDDLRVGRAEGRRALRQRRAQPHRRLPGAARAGARHARAHRRQGLQDRPDADEDDPRARPQGAHARAHAAGSRPTSSATATARCSTTRSRSRPRRSASSACSSTSCSRTLYPDLYGDFYHKVRINYYPPRGDNKEGWDNIDIFGWLGYPMQIKVDFLCRDSILAAPIVLDLALFLDLAQRAGHAAASRSGSLLLQEPDDGARASTRSTTSSSSS